MFIAQAHSFTQQARLAVTLAWIAGYTNILTVLTCGAVTSHVSGTASNLGRDLAQGDWGLGAFALLLIGAFYVGATLSGFCTELGRKLNWESIYVLPMIMEAILLFSFGVVLELNGGDFEEWHFGVYVMTTIAAMAMGLQNATITKISNGVIRTTHVTGVITDLGLETAHILFWMRERQKRNTLALSSVRVVKNFVNHTGANRLTLLLAIFGFFVLGSLLGTFAHVLFSRWAMVPPVTLLGWIVFMDLIRPIAEIEQSELFVNDASGQPLPDSLAVYHVRKAKNRSGKLHHMPNLVAWSQRLPRRIKVVILDLGHDARLDSNAALDVRAVLSLLESQGRKLILVGLSAEECEHLRRASHEKLQKKDFFLDMELALKYAMEVVSRNEDTRKSRAESYARGAAT